MKINYLILINLLALINLSCQEHVIQNTFIPSNSNEIVYEGRIGVQDSITKMYWSGTQIELNFKGTGLKGTFQDNKGDNYYSIIIDNDSIHLLRPGTSLKEYVLASELTDKEHNIKIYKRTEWSKGTTSFYGFRLDSGGQILNRPIAKKRKIEFYGNSITAGYGVEDFTGQDRADSIFTNNYLTYAAITTRYFNAQSHYIVRSGIGIMMSWVPQIMPEIYDKINPLDPNSKWSFSTYSPDIVVINLFQNDSWLVKMPQSSEYLSRFKDKPTPDDNYIIDAYTRFVQTIRDKYPHAHIICMLGNMSIMKKGTPWPGYINKAVNSLNDPLMYTHFIPYKNTPGHPSIDEHQQMAKSLIHFIERNIKW